MRATSVLYDGSLLAAPPQLPISPPPPTSESTQSNVAPVSSAVAETASGAAVSRQKAKAGLELRALHWLSGGDVLVAQECRPGILTSRAGWMHV